MMKHWDNPMQAAHQQALSCGLLRSRCPGEMKGYKYGNRHLINTTRLILQFKTLS